MTPKTVSDEWIFAETERESVLSLSESLGEPWIVAHLLHARGIDTVERAQRFLRPSYESLSDPFLLTDMDKAVERLSRARAKGEHVRIIGDYDVDGISATALLSRGLARYGITQCTTAIPDRLRDGFGINPRLVQQAHEAGVNLIVTVDNGISGHEAAQTAHDCGIDLIITDHHALEDSLPGAHAVINPRRDSENISLAQICGSAVAFKLAVALTGEVHDIGLAALGTVADVVPLTHENRDIVALGCQELSQGAVPGIVALAKQAKLEPWDIRAETIAFQLSPRINASGRIGNGSDSLELLLAKSETDAGPLASRLDALNVERRAIEQVIVDEAKSELEASFQESQRTIVLAKSGWHPGVIGIVASKLQDLYCRPVVIIAIDEDGVGRASARGPETYNMVEGFRACREHLVRYGGHKAAAGLTIERENISDFRAAFEAHAQEHMPCGPLSRRINIDALIGFNEIDSGLLKSIERLEPFGRANPEPVFATYKAEIENGSQRVLKGGHLKCTLRHGVSAFPAIGFGMVPNGELSLPRKVNVAYTPKFNTWRQETTIQLLLKAIEPG